MQKNPTNKDVKGLLEGYRKAKTKKTSVCVEGGEDTESSNK